MDSKRKSGHYWVKGDAGIWVVAYYGSITETFRFPGDPRHWNSWELYDIREERIEEPD